jgi:glycosyltransferase involved in cell wall biosynthesis
VYRALATVNAFAQADWDVTVITANRETFERFTGVDPSMEERVHPRVDVRRVPFEWPVHETDLRQWSALRVRAPGLWRRLRNRWDTVPFPEVGYGPWRARIERAALQVHAERPVDLTVASANPNVDFAPAYLLHRRHQVPFVMDYRDAWLLDVFTGEQMYPDSSRSSRLERRYIAAAQEVWFVNEPIAAWHRSRYPGQADRIFVVANGYDPEFVPAPRRHPSSVHQPLTFGYIGTVSAKVPLESFLAGWKLARERSPLLRDAKAVIRGYLGYYATRNPAQVRLLEEFRQHGVEYAGPVAKADIASVYEQFDALLLILGTGRYVTSGKAYEYIATGLPVAAIHDPGNAATDVFRGHPRWFPAEDLSSESVASAIERTAVSATEATDQVIADTIQFAEAHSRAVQLAPRVTHLLETIDASVPTPARGAVR